MNRMAYTIAEASSALGYKHADKVYALIAKGELRAFRVDDGELRVSAWELERYIKTRENESPNRIVVPMRKTS